MLTGRESAERALFFGILSEIILGHFAHISNSILVGKKKMEIKLNS